ncbi:DUF6401 family natural product biosynthesis protein [Planosporangium mesophilum]|uniref:Uncharacterized protein n=1 Tax=Planosporangium mesophilum TaxID=689768 RepID=A0A8J3X6N4_9ACTN|nr:DUF6401 family natural product biosynthesis protein [Planosporangium mesophilum]NJC85991.1 hypothetical protein [Planosporangium mesophilum]GII25908.1 hypothetical protein Pme01_55050 [Planosporangium mesophilum]
METLSTLVPAVTAGYGHAKSIRFLDHLMARVGVDGLVAALRYPELMTLVNLHEAEVRDSVALDAVGVEPVALADYAAVILGDAMRTGRLLPADPGEVDWLDADWYLLRLVAVCAVAIDSDCL